jgi:hypothetical protein
MIINPPLRELVNRDFKYNLEKQQTSNLYNRDMVETR